MITLHSITRILVFLACALAMPVAKPMTLQSPDDDKVFLAQEVDVKAKLKNKLDSLPTRKNDCPESVEVA